MTVRAVVGHCVVTARQRVAARVQRVREHVDSNLYGVHIEQHGAPITRVQRVREWLRVAAQHVRYDVGALVCRRVGHRAEWEEFVAAERDARGRIVDIDGGGVDWHCTRCGVGGRSWF